MKTALLLLFLLPLLGAAQKTLRLKGKIDGLKDSSLVVLTDVNRPTDTLASATASKGKFELKTVLKEPMPVLLTLAPGVAGMSFLSNEKTSVRGKFSEPEKLKYSGSASAKDFQVFQEKFNPLFARLNSVGREMQQLGQTDSLLSSLNLLRDTIMTEVDRFIASRKSSPVSSFLVMITAQLTEDFTKIESRVASLKASALENMYGEYLQDMIAEKKITAVGSLAQDFTQADTAGVDVSLSSFRGKYVLLDFWASWCGPCRQENPNVVANFNKFNKKNFTVLGVSLDRPGQKDKWIQAIHQDGLTWTHVSDLKFWENAVAKQYRVQSIPQNLLIGPDGKIIAKDLRGPDLETKLCEVLGCD